MNIKGAADFRQPPGDSSRYPLRSFDLLFHTVAVAFDYHGFGVVYEAVQHGAGSPVGAGVGLRYRLTGPDNQHATMVFGQLH